jgi:hypothetical protein
METVCSSETLASTYETIQRQDPRQQQQDQEGPDDEEYGAGMH